MALSALGSGFEALVVSGVTALSRAIPAGTARERALAMGRDRAMLGRLTAYLDALVEWNERTDLTAARSVEELVDLFVVDAAFLASVEEGVSWVDVGAGAGAPGLVVALLRSDLRITLVEPKDRRVAFMRSMIGKFSLTHASVERGRSDRLPPQGWDVAVSRATLPPPDWLKEGARLSRGGVWVLLAKDDAPERKGMKVAIDLDYPWPLTGVTRRAVRYIPDAESTP